MLFSDKPTKRFNESIENYVKRASKILNKLGYSIKEISCIINANDIDVYNALQTDPNRMITTEAERQEMLQLRSEGLSYRQIADRVNKSYGVVYNRIHSPAIYIGDINMDDKLLTKKEINSIKKWYESGKTMGWIARKIGVPDNNIKKRLVAMGIYDKDNSEKKEDKLTTTERKQIVDLYESGASILEIVKEVGRSQNTIRKYLIKKGLLVSK